MFHKKKQSSHMYCTYHTIISHVGTVQFVKLNLLFKSRPIQGIRGLTREVVVALTTNIESQVLYTS